MSAFDRFCDSFLKGSQNLPLFRTLAEQQTGGDMDALSESQCMRLFAQFAHPRTLSNLIAQQTAGNTVARTGMRGYNLGIAGEAPAGYNVVSSQPSGSCRCSEPVASGSGVSPPISW